MSRITSKSRPIGKYATDQEGFVNPKPGGTLAVKKAQVTAAANPTTATHLFSLLPSEKIARIEVITTTAWDDATTNTFDLGLDGDTDALASGASVAAIGLVAPVDGISQWHRNRSGPTSVTVKSNGAAPNVGISWVVMWYYVEKDV